MTASKKSDGSTSSVSFGLRRVDLVEQMIEPLALIGADLFTHLARVLAGGRNAKR